MYISRLQIRGINKATTYLINEPDDQKTVIWRPQGHPLPDKKQMFFGANPRFEWASLLMVFLIKSLQRMANLLDPASESISSAISVQS